MNFKRNYQNKLNLDLILTFEMFLRTTFCFWLFVPILKKKYNFIWNNKIVKKTQ